MNLDGAGLATRGAGQTRGRARVMGNEERGAVSGSDRSGEGDASFRLGFEDTAAHPGLRRFSHEAMATVFEVYADHPDERYASQAAHAAFGVIDRLEQDLSRFRPSSDVSRINGLAAGRHTVVSASTFECLAIARHAYDLTASAFDVSIGTGLPSLVLDPDRSVVRTSADGVRIDLGGIGKGYAVDVVAEVLEEWGLVRALVHGGFSSVLALDSSAGTDGWPLTLSDPATPSRVLSRVHARQCALGASGLVKGAHIVDPRRGKPSKLRRAAWALVPVPKQPGASAGGLFQPRAAAVADALATAFMIMTTDDIEALCTASPGLEAWVLHEPSGDRSAAASLQHIGGVGPGYTAAAT